MSVAAVKIGDWIRPYSKGIWRVSRVLRDFNEFRYRLSEPKVRSQRVPIFSNRLVNDSWKRSFATECSEQAWVTAISSEDQQKIDQLLKDEKLRNAFEKFEGAPKPIDLIVNLRFGPLPDADRKRFGTVISESLDELVQRGATLDEVLECVRAARYEDCMGSNPSVAGLQLVSPNHELRGAEFVIRRYQIREF